MFTTKAQRTRSFSNLCFPAHLVSRLCALRVFVVKSFPRTEAFDLAECAAFAGAVEVLHSGFG